MLRRKMYDRLLEWKREKHKCLLIKGQRQVGKTFIVNEFGKAEYDNYFYFDLSKNDSARKVFDDNLDVSGIVRDLGFVISKDMPEGSLIFLDEIQECPRARSSLKNFTMDGRYDVIASGSLLGVDNANLKKPETLLPSGYEKHMTMYSLDFEEFLWANGVDEKYISDLRNHISNKEPLSNAYLDRFTKLFRDFMIIGGMPESVQAFVDTKGYERSYEALDDIIETCRNDINRYNRGMDIVKTLDCFESIAPQLAQTNKKFTYSRIENNPSRRASDKYRENLLWIRYAGYGNYCHLLSSVGLPLKSHRIPDAFKVYLSDTGLLVRMYGDETANAIHFGATEFNNGAIMENVVAECLTKSGIEPMCYRKTNGTNKMELDFVTENDMKAVVIEVKSGKSRDAPSLNKAIELFDFGRKIMFGKDNIGIDENGVEHYPFFVAAFIRDIIPKTKIEPIESDFDEIE